MRLLVSVISLSAFAAPLTAMANGPIFSRQGSIQAPGPAPTYSIDANSGIGRFRVLDGNAAVGTTTLNGMVASIATSQSMALASQTMAANAIPKSGGTMIGALTIGTSDNPLVLSTAPSASGLNIEMVSPGTPGSPGPSTAHHGLSGSCIKKDYFGTVPPPGEIDCLNIVARQDGVVSDSQPTADAGDLGGLLIDLASTLRAQNFTAFVEEHTSVVDTRTNTVPYFLDIQEGAINTTGHPNDDGTAAGNSSMQAWFAGLIDGHGSGLMINEQNDTSATAGKLGHGVIDHVLQAGHYDGEEFVDIDGNGNLWLPDGTVNIGNGSKGIGGAILAPSFVLGSDRANGNLQLGASSGNQLASETPYIDFNGSGVTRNVRLVSDAVGQLSLLGPDGHQYYSFSQTAATIPGDLVLPDNKSIHYGPDCLMFHDTTVSPAGLVLKCHDVRIARFPDDGSAPIFKVAPVVGSP